MKITLPERLYLRSLLDGIQEDVSHAITVDDSRLRTVMASGITGLASLLEYHREKGHPIVWTPSASGGVNYLRNMGLFRVLNLDLAATAVVVPENRAFARLEKITWETDTTRMAANLSKSLELHAPQIHADTLNCLEESIRNIVDHARKPGFAAAQVHLQEDGNRQYRIAIADYGRGILESLTEGWIPVPENARQALDLACQRGVSSALHRNTPDFEYNSGQGLYTIDRITESCAAEFILTSDGWCRIRQGAEVRYTETTRAPGTFLELCFSASGLRQLPPLPARRFRRD